MDQLLRHSLDPAGFVSLETAHSQTRVWFLGDGTVRIRTSFSGDFRESSLSLLRTAWEDAYDALLSRERRRVSPLLPTVDSRDPACLLLWGDGLYVRINRDPFAISLGRDGCSPAFREVPGRACTWQRGLITHSFCLDESSFYGFGEKTGPLEKTGSRMRMSNKDACGYDPEKTDPLYKHIPWFIKLSPDGREACGIFYHTDADCSLDIGREFNGYWPRMGQFVTTGDEVDLFFLAGPSMADVVKRFCRLTGLPTLLPQYAFGYLGSTMFYSELPRDCHREILNFVRKTQEEQIPCSNFQLSSGYTTDSHGLRNVFSWNLDKFPDPRQFVEEMEHAGAPVTPNIKPALLTTNPLYDTFAQAGAFIRTREGTPYITRFWGGKGSFVDFTNPEGRRLWKHYLRERLLDNGIHSLWNDNNEFDITDPDAICHNEGNPVPACTLRARLPMLMNMAGREALAEAFPEKRHYQVTRSGNPGICRYAQTWTGDNYTCWESLRFNIATMLGSGLSGMALTGSDIGGFAGPAPEEELFLRWIWCGVLLPRFSIHSANNDNTVTEPWMYPHRMDIVRSAFRLRHKLSAHLYSLAAHAHASGEPILRPMVYEFPADPEMRKEDVNFMVGSALLAACVVEKGARERTICLPAEETFYALFTRKAFKGGQAVTVPAPLDSTPLFQRGGSILPLREEDGIHLWICPDKPCSFTLYEDDGESNAFLSGSFLGTTVAADWQDKLLCVTLREQGSFQAQEKLVYHIQCPDIAPVSVICQGETLPQILDEARFAASALGWHYCHATKSCTIHCGTGRGLGKLLISFGKFDLIRMDETE